MRARVREREQRESEGGGRGGREEGRGEEGGREGGREGVRGQGPESTRAPSSRASNSGRGAGTKHCSRRGDDGRDEAQRSARD